MTFTNCYLAYYISAGQTNITSLSFYVTICSAFIHTLEMLFNVLFALLIVELLSMYAFLLHCAIIRISYLVSY